MSQKATNAHEEAYNKALEEISKEKITEIKAVAKTILQQMQKYKEQKEEAEEAMRLLKLDLDDLREGKIDKIRERHEKSKKAETYSPITIPATWATYNNTNGVVTTNSGSGNLYLTGNGSANTAGPNPYSNGTAGDFGTSATNSVVSMMAQAQELHNKLWNDMTSGTYFIDTKSGGVKEFWL